MKLDVFSKSLIHEKKILVVNKYNTLDSLIVNKNFLVCNLEEKKVISLAKDVLIYDMAKNNIFESINLINNDLKVAYFKKLLNTSKYSFIPKESISIKTVSEVVRICDVLRSSKRLNSKNDRIKILDSLIKDYIDILNENNLYDEISLIEKAKIILSKDDIKYENVYIIDYVYNKLSYLEKSFLNSLCSLTVIDTKENVNNSFRFYSVYGEYNEVVKVVKDIKENKVALSDACLILSSSSYEMIAKSVLSSYNIPYSYVSSYSVLSNDAISFILNIIKWAKNNFSYKYFINIIDNKYVALNTSYIEKEDLEEENTYQIGIDLDISYSIERYRYLLSLFENMDKFYEKIESKNYKVKREYIKEDVILKFKDFLSKLLNVFLEKKSISSLFLNMLSLIKDKCENDEAYKKMKELAEIIKINDEYKSLEDSLNVIYEYIVQIKVKDIEDNKKLKVSTLNEEEPLTRKYNYFIGMSYDAFEDSIKDSAILTDKEILEECDNSYYLDLSLNASKNKKEVFLNTIYTLRDSNIILIRANYSTNDFRPLIPSLIYNELKKDRNEEVEESKYFERIELEGGEVLSFNKGNSKLSFNITNTIKINEKDVYSIKYPLTASNLNSIVKCPLMYLYSLNYFDKKYEDKSPYEWLNHIERGNLCHEVLEEYARALIGIKSYVLSDECDQALFNKIYENKIKKYKEDIICPSEGVFKVEYDKYKNFLIRYINNLHKDLKKNRMQIKGVETLVSTEKFKDKEIYLDSEGNSLDKENIESKALEISFKQNTRIDRLDISEDDNSLRIVDYKSSSKAYDKEKMKENLQWFVYSYLEEAESFEYHFLCVKNKEDIERVRKEKEAFKTIDKETGKILYDFYVLNTFKTKEDACKYCAYKDICIKRLKVAKEE